MRKSLILLGIILFLGICWDYIFNPNYEKIFSENKLYFDAHKEDLKSVIIDLEHTNLKT